MVKEERGGQPWRRKQAEQRKWHRRAKSQDLELTAAFVKQHTAGQASRGCGAAAV